MHRWLLILHASLTQRKQTFTPLALFPCAQMNAALWPTAALKSTGSPRASLRKRQFLMARRSMSQAISSHDPICRGKIKCCIPGMAVQLLIFPWISPHNFLPSSLMYRHALQVMGRGSNKDKDLFEQISHTTLSQIQTSTV